MNLLPPGVPFSLRCAASAAAPAPVPLPDDAAAALRHRCHVLLADVSAFDRKSLLAGLSPMRRADDLWRLRDALFEAISRTHGDGVARTRLASLDEPLQ